MNLNADSDANGSGSLTLAASALAGLSQQAQLNASDGAAFDDFGTTVALSTDGMTAIVGAPEDTVGSNGSQGSAYIFTRSGDMWIQQQKLTASDGAPSTTLAAPWR